jgi:FkbM family methyltransferase
MRRVRLIPTLSWLLRRALPGSHVLPARASSGLVFYADARDLVGRHVSKYGTYEPRLTAWIAQHLASRTSPGIVVDVGANIGWHALHAARSDKVTAVVACEPDAFNAWLLDRNITANAADDKVVIAAWAIGASGGRARLNRYKPSNRGRHSLLRDYGLGSRSVPMLDLDATLALLGFQDAPIHLLKIDVEGYELEVICGADRSLARADAIVLEFSPELMQPAGSSVDGLLDRLSKAGFSPFALRRTGKPEPLSVQRLAERKGQIDLVWRRNS